MPRWTKQELEAYYLRRNNEQLANDRNLKAARELKMTIQPSKDVVKLNKTERRFYDWLRAAGYEWIGVQNITLKLADDCRYTPDFFCFPCGLGDQLEALEVKGFWRDDAKVKIKVAARLFPFIHFRVVTWDGKSWTITPVTA